VFKGIFGFCVLVAEKSCQAISLGLLIIAIVERKEKNQGLTINHTELANKL